MKQGDIPSPTFFNLVIDAIIRAEEQERLSRGTRDEEADIGVTFYADDGRIGGEAPDDVHGSLDSFTDLFSRMGLKMNVTKTEAMTAAPEGKPTQKQAGAYHRKLGQTGAEYMERSRETGVCPFCSREMQKRSLARHVQDQHPGEVPPGWSWRTSPPR